MKFLIIAIFAIIGTALAQTQNYCDSSLCRSGGRHIACPGVAVNRCPSDARAIPMDNTMKNLILGKHNANRNALAGGQVNRFATAAAMPEVTWDDELAYIASKNAMQCTFGHDQCRNTKAFMYAGQNIAYAMGSAYTDSSFVEQMINLWWDEYKQCSQAVLDKFQNTQAVVGHFTVMSTDRTNKIGCAAVLYNRNYRILVCNYSFTNMMGQPIYKKGSVRSGCKSGASNQYPNLCSANEVVNPNPF
ncbi:antigen 5 like allergen Cul n 1-like [Culicoides brevitarsis]|uniref:antigen 5 like allergen Cul n 1-like n=1 Tax=Culicoides brevitarsis TaxID=469753 RepID=UPI00307BBD05